MTCASELKRMFVRVFFWVRPPMSILLFQPVAVLSIPLPPIFIIKEIVRLFFFSKQRGNIA